MKGTRNHYCKDLHLLLLFIVLVVASLLVSC